VYQSSKQIARSETLHPSLAHDDAVRKKEKYKWKVKTGPGETVKPQQTLTIAKGSCSIDL
jgi:hypothetical protein